MMKGIGAGGGVLELCKSGNLLRIPALFVITVMFFYLGKRFSDGSSQQLVFFSSRQAEEPQRTAGGVSPNVNKTFDVSPLGSGKDFPLQENSRNEPQKVLTPPSAPPPPPPVLQRMGVLDKNGRMTENFEVGEYDPELVNNWSKMNSTDDVDTPAKGDKVLLRVKKFPSCPASMTDHIPCMDNEDFIKNMKSANKGEMFERHCPEPGKGLNCSIPAPKGYKTPIPWPRSRDEVWFSNVPHPRLAEDKGAQNWIMIKKDKFKFPGGGTQFIHGADPYLDQIEKMVPEIAFGRHTRVALDIGCGVASFGAYLLSRNVIPLSIAPKDVHENQIQFALERGVPAMVAAFATRRLPYPSQAFDLMHCSRCRINWTRDDGILLIEADRMLRAGGYFVWAAQPVYKHEVALEKQWEEMTNLTSQLCWTLVKKEGYIAVWRKPFNNSCYLSRSNGTSPPLCSSDDDPDKFWYVDLKPCITRLPENGYGANVLPWPERLRNPPDRLQSIKIEAYISRKELFRAESRYWHEIVDGFVRILRWNKFKLRNVLDMRAGFGGFTAALVDHKLDCWVLNVVPTSGPNTLPVIYDRGLVGVMHDWCEPFDTYPRTYDLIHAAGLFSVEQKKVQYLDNHARN
ncbi:probable methyltransferase PMT11 isoform X2 [Andrographis paniculata]|uniref:probable methyltransferase PMT11 isoform X2 n=1 Tax=Andrographis paniculata TaxID=175694 RepID=UPI0021E85409|nr:probable methyltransferase PMT11 isoform X2 [Andrographis paniculata]